MTVVVAHTTGPVLELGCGDYSTRLLHGIYSAKKRYLLSADNNQAWIGLFGDLKRDWHELVFVPATDSNWLPWDHIENDIHWSVVFIDHEPQMRRHVDIERLRKNADIFVIYDLQMSEMLHFEPILKTFRYKYEDTTYLVSTVVVSDTIDVSEFFK